MKISIIAVGNIKDKFYKDAVLEYSKRISKFCEFEIIEAKEEKIPDNAGDSVISQIKKTEMENIIKKTATFAKLKSAPQARQKCIIIVLDIHGKALDSVEFADKLEEYFTFGYSNICFIIGGSLGIHEDFLKKADFRLSLSAMTFPHVLARVILTEQIYRAFKIMKGQKYHK